MELFDENNNKIVDFEFLRSQELKEEGPNYCFADYVCPEGENKDDYIGMFAITAGIGIEQHVERFEKDDDDYSAIMLKTLADRLAEALAELMHKKTRTRILGLRQK